MIKTSSAFLAAALCSGAVHAAIKDAGALPPAQTRGDVAWISGGVGQDQAKVFEHASARYPLTLEFIVKPEGKGAKAEFTAAVPVTITDKQGKALLSAVSQGPFMLLKLPAGRYTVVAEHRGEKIERHVIVGRGHHRVVFEWAVDARMAT